MGRALCMEVFNVVASASNAIDTLHASGNMFTRRIALLPVHSFRYRRIVSRSLSPTQLC